MALILHPKPSKSLAFSLYCIHGLSLIASFANAWPYPIDGLLACCVMLSFWSHLRAPPKVEQIEIKSDGHWLISLKDGNSLEANLLAETWVSVWLIILQIETHQGKQSILLCRDSLDEDSFRQLRVRLKLNRSFKVI